MKRPQLSSKRKNLENVVESGTLRKIVNQLQNRKTCQTVLNINNIYGMSMTSGMMTTVKDTLSASTMGKLT